VAEFDNATGGEALAGRDACGPREAGGTLKNYEKGRNDRTIATFTSGVALTGRTWNN
jgi:hypothetical protein